MRKPANLSELDEADLTLERPRATLAEVAADKLREFILLEKLPAGATISEREVAAALGISRTPLRGALAMLEQEGLVDYSVTRRPRVADPSLEEISENLVVMGVLEALGGELACANASDAEIARVVELRRAMEEGSGVMQPVEFFQTDMEMHESIVRASGNRALIQTHRQYNARLWRARFMSSQRSDGRELTLAEHVAIVDALQARDGVATARALRVHLASALINTRTGRAEREAREHKEREA